DTTASTAAVTSPLLSRLTAAVCPALTSTKGAPATENASQTSTRDAEYLSSIATRLLARSGTDLISGRAITTATKSDLLGRSPVAVIRSAPPVAAATCSCMVLLLEFGGGLTVGCPIVPESAAATLLFGSRCVLNEGGGVGVRVAVDSVFAVVLADFAFLVM